MLDTNPALQAHLRRVPPQTAAVAGAIASFMQAHGRRPSRKGDENEVALFEQMRMLCAYYPAVAQHYGFAQVDKPERHVTTFAERTAKALASAQEINTVVAKQKRVPKRSRINVGTDEQRLADALVRLREHHPEVTEENGLTPDALTKRIAAFPRRVLKPVITAAKAVQTFVTARGFLPSSTSADWRERSLARRMTKVREEHPSTAKEYGFAKGDAPTRPPPNGRAYQRTSFADRLVASVRGAERPTNGFPEALANDPLACQATTPSRMWAEVERDCWCFTLEGQTSPDPRVWHELRVSGDHAAIVGATRVAYLDFAAFAESKGLKRAPRRVY